MNKTELLADIATLTVSPAAREALRVLVGELPDESSEEDHNQTFWVIGQNPENGHTLCLLHYDE